MKEKLITVSDVAAFLGITKMGVYGMVFKKGLPAIKISKRCLRFRPSDIEKWLVSKTQAAVLQRPSTEPKHRSSGRVRKNGVKADYIDRIIENAKKEVEV